MSSSDTTERKRLIIQRRARRICKEHDMQLDKRRMFFLTSACVNTLGEEGVTDVDLWTLIRLTSRGLLDDFTFLRGAQT